MRAWFLSTVLLSSVSSLVSAADDRINGKVFLDAPLDAAKQSAPFWFFGRSLNREPCYPESAVNAEGNGPNPGTSVPAGPSPGSGCPSPGEWKGRFTHGNRFPTYWTARHCDATANAPRRWQITYSLYFSHDGMGGIGHRHDWEWVSVAWAQCDSANDMWCRHSIHRSYHKQAQYNPWNEARGINGVEEIDHNDDFGKHFPLDYVGAFKHASFNTRKTSVNVLGADGDEFRSNDWWWFAGDDLVEGSAIPKDWKYGEAASTPMAMWDNICNTSA